jgi:hypothetical protein
VSQLIVCACARACADVVESAILGSNRFYCFFFFFFSWHPKNVQEKSASFGLVRFGRHEIVGGGESSKFFNVVAPSVNGQRSVSGGSGLGSTHRHRQLDGSNPTFLVSFC